MGFLRRTVFPLIFLSISANSFPTMNQQDSKHIEGIPTDAEFKSTWSKPPLDPWKDGHKSLQLDLTSADEKELARTPEIAASTLIESEQTLPEMDVELEEDENYPTEVIEEALKSASSVVKEYLRLRGRVTSNAFGHQISKRNTQDPEEYTQRLCAETRSRYAPTSPRHSAEPGDDRLYIPVNLPDRGEGLPEVIQAVQVGRCDMTGLNTATDSLGGHNSWCKQEYMELPMVALVQDTTTLVITKFSFPHSCACYVKP